MVQALQGQSRSRIYGDGSQTRSFCYVDDLIEGFIRLMDSPPEMTGPINLGNPGEFTIRELAEIGDRDDRLAARNSTFEPLPTDDPKQRQPDIARAKEQLDWQPKVPLRDGLKPTIAYFDRLLSEGAFAG